jgi:hypothetical protein
MLVAVARHGPPGAWIAAGCLRNALWDATLGRRQWAGNGRGRWPASDVDVVFHAPGPAMAETDAAWTSRLSALCPGPAWSVSNQARMHRRNGHAPYRGLDAALAHWPETATALAARLRGGRVEVLAPLGLGDLLRGVLRPGPAHRQNPAAVRARIRAKCWARRWPRLRARGV